MSKTTSKSTLPEPRRVITGHNEKGRAIVVRDDVRKPFALGKSVLRHDIHVTKETPAKVDSERDSANNGAWKDEAETLTSMFNENGSVFTFLDFEPEAGFPMHRGISMDYAIVMKGSITLILDDGLEVTLKEGDTVVQRSTMHGWRNHTKDWCRIAFIILPAKAPLINGKALEMNIPWLKKSKL